MVSSAVWKVLYGCGNRLRLRKSASLAESGGHDMSIESEMFLAKYSRLHGDLIVLEAMLYVRYECC